MISLALAMVVAGMGVLSILPVSAQEAKAPPPTVEEQLLAAQNLIVSGKLDDGLKTLHETLGKVVPEMAGRVTFIERLIEVRVADKLGDQAKLAAGLTEAVKLATEPDQMLACWGLGLDIARASVAAGKPNAMGILNFLSVKIVPGLELSRPHIALSQLYLAAGSPAKAEAELVKAAAILKDAEETKLWTNAVDDLAKTMDGGALPQAGLDLYARLRATVAAPVQAALDIAQCKAFLRADNPVAGLEVYERVAAMTEADSLEVLPLGYRLAAAFAKAGDAEQTEAMLEKADAFAGSLPPLFEKNKALIETLLENKFVHRAANVALEAAEASEVPNFRQELLALYAQAAVAAGREGELLTNLKSMNAPQGLYTQAAATLAKAGRTPAALAFVSTVQTGVLADGPAADIVTTMKEIQAQRKQLAERQAASCLAIAAKFTEAAKQMADAKNAERAAAFTKQAEAFKALAAEMEK